MTLGSGSTDNTTETLIHEDFSRLRRATDSSAISAHTDWNVHKGALFTNSRNDGAVTFDTVSVVGNTAMLSFDATSADPCIFESHQDFLKVYLHIEGVGDVLLDEFRTNGHAFVGSKTGQTFGDGGYSGLSYEYDLPEGATNVTLKFVSHTTTKSEWMKIDNVKLQSEIDPPVSCAPVTETVIHEDFGGLHRPTDSGAISQHTAWDIKYGALFTDACNDGVLRFDAVTVDADTATLTFNAKSADPCIFEAHQDFLKVFLHIEGVGDILLDDFRTNGHEMVGSKTGQTFKDGAYTGLTYEVDLPEGATDVSLKFVSYTTTTSEWMKIDDVKLETTAEGICNLCPEGAKKIDFEGFAKGATEAQINDALSGVTITALRNGRNDGADFVMEAEHMWESGFHTVHSSKASGGAFEKLNGHCGTLFDRFGGADGTYEVKIRLQDENDGQSWVKVTIGHEVKWIKMDRDSDGAGSDHGPFSEVSLGEFEVHTGEAVKIEVWANGGEFGRIDALKFHNVDAPVTSGDAMIFDTDHPTGGDFDLSAGDGNVLIISEDNDSSDPDDNVSGGAVRFDFDTPAILYTLDVVDTEEGGTIEFFDETGARIGEVEVPRIGDNTTATVDLGGIEGVSSMIVTLNGSGALDNLCYDDVVVPAASLGNFVFLDANADGIQDAGEQGIAGVTVTLTGGGADGVIGTTDDTTAITVTDEDGFYEFTDLTPGTEYRVTFDQPTGLEVSPSDAGTDDTVDSDGLVSRIVTLAPGENNTTLDQGFYELAGLGDFVFEDLDGDGVQDAGEPGVEGVSVELKDATGAVVASTTTGPNGAYSFTGLIPGIYAVMFTAPPGFAFTRQDAQDDDGADSDADPITGMTQQVTLTSGEFNGTLDAGLVRPASLGDTVFFDSNRDGIQDAEEAGVEGVTVTLTGGGADGIIGTADDTTEVQTTNAAGTYLFEGLTPGTEYQVTFSGIPAGTVFTTPDAGDDALDSDADPATGATPIVVLASGEQNLTIDAGIFVPNVDPTAVNDLGGGCADELVTVANVLSNDSDPDGGTLSLSDTITFEGVTYTVADGAVDVNVGGVFVSRTGDSFTFDAEAALAGLDIGEKETLSFGYEVTDGQGGSATASMEVTFCGDANSVDSFVAALPTSVTYRISDGFLNDPVADFGYDLQFTAAGGDARFENVEFKGAYCLDFDRSILTGIDLPAAPTVTGDMFVFDDTTAGDLFLSGQDGVNGLAIDNVNEITWILNQGFETDGTGSVDGTFTGWEVQFAIWELTNAFDSDFTLAVVPGIGQVEDVDYIVNRAIAEGFDFEAGVGDVIAVAINPNPVTTENEQPFVIGVQWEDFDCLCIDNSGSVFDVV